MGSFFRSIDTASRHKEAAVVVFGMASEYYKLADPEIHDEVNRMLDCFRKATTERSWSYPVEVL
jgi:hypothetical protein